MSYCHWTIHVICSYYLAVVCKEWFKTVLSDAFPFAQFALG